LEYPLPFIKRASQIPAQIRYIPSIPTPPNLVETDSIETRTRLVTSFRLGSRLTYGSISVYCNIEWPLTLVSFPFEEWTYSRENWNAGYGGYESETVRFFTGLGFTFFHNFRFISGMLFSKYSYVFRSFTEKTVVMGSGMYYGIPEKGKQRNTYKKYKVASERFQRLYASATLLDEEDRLSVTLVLLFENNPFWQKKYKFNGEPLVFEMRPEHRLGVHLSFAFYFF
jgi:hypothetical protein